MTAGNPADVDGVGIGVVPKQKRGIEVRDRLFEAAVAEIVEHGVEASRVENVVEAAGTSWGTFFRYFPRKEDILLFESSRQFRQYVRPTYDAGIADDSKPVKVVAREMFGEMMKPRRTPRFQAEMIAETVGHPFRFAAILGEGELPIIGLVNNLMIKGQASGEVSAGAPPHICATVLSAGVVFSTNQVLRAVAAGHLPGTEIAAVADQAFDLAWSGLGA